MFLFLGRRVFKAFSAAETNEDSAVLIELCNALETLAANENDCLDVNRRQPSIIDPPVPRMRCPRATPTSSNVDQRAKELRTNRTEEYQQAVLNLEKRPRRVLRKSHMCSVCLGEGLHPQTCQRLLADENAERADAFFKLLVETG